MSIKPPPVPDAPLATCSTEFARGWLQGFFDGEGSATFRATTFRVTDSKSKKQDVFGMRCQVDVCNTDYNLILICMSYLNLLGIGFRWEVAGPREYRKKTLYRIAVGRKTELLKFRDLIGFASHDKQERLERAIQWLTRERSQYGSVMLRGMYIDQKMSMKDMALSLGRKPGYEHQIRDLLIRYDIPVRPRDVAIRLAKQKTGTPDISEETLRRLYLDEFLSPYRICLALGIEPRHQSHVRQLIIRHNIPRRKHGDCVRHGWIKRREAFAQEAA